MRVGAHNEREGVLWHGMKGEAVGKGGSGAVDPGSWW